MFLNFKYYSMGYLLSLKEEEKKGQVIIDYESDEVKRKLNLMYHCYTKISKFVYVLNPLNDKIR